MNKLTVKEVYDFAFRRVYHRDERDFHKDVEEAFGFSHFPENLKSKIHSVAWEDGHSAGYYEVVSCYFDIVDIAKIALGEKQY